MSSPDSSIRRALAAGLPAWHVAALAAERRHQAEDLDPPPAGPGAAAGELYWQAVDDALVHPLAPSYDELWVRRMRRTRRIRP